MNDSYGRKIDYMRISITDRCNLRCRYCMPEEGVNKVSMRHILTYEEILKICEQAVSLGINRFKVTGGEPLVRKGCPGLIRMIKSIHGVEQVTLTTNGQLLGDFLDELIHAGVDGINVSMDSLKEDRYREITRGGELKKVLESIDRALEEVPMKVNCLLQKDVNDDEVYDFAEFAFDKGLDMRFIETMPVGSADAGEGLSNKTVLLLLQEKWPALTSDNRIHGNGPAEYYRIPGEKGSIGLISAIHGKFCNRCNRIRLTSQGRIKPCLCYGDTVDIMPALREGTEADVRSIIEKAIMEKPMEHCFETGRRSEKLSMVEIGG